MRCRSPCSASLTAKVSPLSWPKAVDLRRPGRTGLSCPRRSSPALCGYRLRVRALSRRAKGAPVKTRIDPPHQVASAEPAGPAPAARPLAEASLPDDARPAHSLQPLGADFRANAKSGGPIGRPIVQAANGARSSRSRGQRPSRGRRQPGSHGSAVADRKAGRSGATHGHIECGRCRSPCCCAGASIAGRRRKHPAGADGKRRGGGCRRRRFARQPAGSPEWQAAVLEPAPLARRV